MALERMSHGVDLSAMRAAIEQKIGRPLRDADIDDDGEGRSHRLYLYRR